MANSAKPKALAHADLICSHLEWNRNVHRLRGIPHTQWTACHGDLDRLDLCRGLRPRVVRPIRVNGKGCEAGLHAVKIASAVVGGRDALAQAALSLNSLETATAMIATVVLSMYRTALCQAPPPGHSLLAAGCRSHCAGGHLKPTRNGPVDRRAGHWLARCVAPAGHANGKTKVRRNCIRLLLADEQHASHCATESVDRA